MNRMKWLVRELWWLYVRGYHVVFKKYPLDFSDYGGHVLHNAKDGNSEIARRIASKAPFSFCRFSYVEMDLIIRCRTEQYWGIQTYKQKKDIIKMYEVKGETAAYGIRRFSELMKNAIYSADVLGVWRNIPMGDAYIESLSNLDDKYFADACAVEPYAYSNPWSAQLKGKKVLVVSPFSKEIREQYSKRDHLWKNKNILPEFTLDTVDSVWYFFDCKDDRFDNWFEALDYLFEQIMKKDFDIALLGCGPFGFPLAAKIKESGKQAIHMGGAVQILFGIKGKRWDNTGIGNFYNQYWIRPEETSKPQEAGKLDDYCYW